jgi:hypothetical protein
MGTEQRTGKLQARALLPTTLERKTLQSSVGHAHFSCPFAGHTFFCLTFLQITLFLLFICLVSGDAKFLWPWRACDKVTS